MTVNNTDDSSLTDAGRSLAILQDLCRTITRTSEAEALTIRELRSLRYSGDKEGSAAFQEVDTGLGNAAAGVDAEYGARWDRMRRHHETRHLKIEQLRQAGLRDLPRRVEEVRSSYLGDLQRQKLRLERLLSDEKQAVARQAGDPVILGERKEALDKLIARTKRAFSGSLLLTRRLGALAAEAKTGPFPAGSPDERLTALGSHLEKADEHLTVIRKAPLARLFGVVPGYVMALLGLLAGGIIAFLGGFAGAALWIGVVVALGLAAVAVAGMFSSLGQEAAAGSLREHLGQAMRLHHAVGEEGAEFIARRHGELDERHAVEAAVIQEKWQGVDAVAAAFRERALAKLNTQPQRLLERNETRMEQRRVVLDAEHSRAVAALESGAAAERARAEEVRARNAEAFAAEESHRWSALTDRWKQEATPLMDELGAAAAAAQQAFPAWNPSFADTWVPADRFLPVTRIGSLHVDFATHPGKLPADPRLALPGPAAMDVPVCLSYPNHGSLLFETSATAGTELVTGSLNNVILRLLASVPPGKLSFTIIDPVGLGQNFAGLMHLGDFEESLINRRIWTQRDQIEERLAELSEHIEKVIQMYLRNEYETITQYNEQAGSVAEKYYFLTVSDFPSQFSDVAVRRLMSIATSGSRCGVFTLIHWDTRLPSPDGFVPDELRKNSLVIRQEKSGAFILGNGPSGPGTALHLDPPPDADVSMALVQKIGKASIDSNRVEVPFRQIAPAPDALWTGDTTSELRIAVGRTGATKHQFLAIGKGTRQHALFAGKTGSGKSTLFHVIITNLALTCSPEQVEFYLIDFKKGVEFKCYATHHLPHARVVAIESDREFALSVLQRVDDELKRRGDKFRKLGVQDIAGYKRAGGTDPIPRTLLIIDEFQEFFVEDDTIAQSASLLFDRIVRQGRAFGIHVLLGSQTLGGAYSLARATLGQMVIRVALMCNEADAYLIMDDSNSAPRLLSRPGEGIYNDAAGAVEGNSPFQVVWLPDEERDQWLEKVEDLARERGTTLPPPVVFEGNAPADLGENELLRRCLAKPATQAAAAGRLWLGAPNSIKGPTEAVFRRQSGNHLLIVGQRDEAALTMLGVGLLSLAAQYPAGGVRFYLIDITPPGSPEAAFLERVVAAIPHEVTLARTPEVPAVMGALAAELKERSAGEVDSSTAPPVYVFLHGMHKFKKLRQEDDFSFSMDDSEDTGNPAKQFTDIITEGSTHGIHLITTVDTFNNVNRSINRKALTEFEMRVVFQMSANDSASLIDSPRASTLGLHRALFYNEQEGTLETFRPYATPELPWVATATAALHPSDVV